MKKFLLIPLLFLSYLHAFDKVSLGYGTTTYNSDIYNLTFIKESDYKLLNKFPLSLELSLESVNSDKTNEDFFITSIQPILTYDFTKEIFLEAGLGFAYFSDKEFEYRNFGMHFQFKESIGLGYKFTKQLSSNIKYTHYSNANIKDDNSGLDIFMLSLVYKF